MSKTSGRHSRFPAVNRGAGEGRPASRPTPAPEPTPVPTPDPDPVVEETPEATLPDFADMTIDEIVEWVGDDPERKEAALAGEAAGKGRKSLATRLGD